MSTLDRLEAADAAQEAGTSSSKSLTLIEKIDRQLPEVSRALPAHMDAERFLRIATTQLRRTPKLLTCESASILGSIMQLAQVGLEPDGRNAHLVPFGKECTAIIDYRGFMELARRSGLVADIYAYEVRQGDEFAYQLGLHRDVVHRPAPAGERGELTHAYAVVNFTTGGFAFEVLNADEIGKRRAASKTAGRSDSMWQTSPAAAWKKSAVRALSPYLPYSPELARAEQLDNKVEYGTEEMGAFIDAESEEVDDGDEQ